MDILWEKSVSRIRERVSPQNFDTWIKPLRLAAREDNHVRFLVPNRFFRDWLADNYQAIIAEALTEAAGVPLSVDFLICSETAQARAPQAGVADASRTKHKTTKTKTNPSLNAHYSFERFVVGSCNQFAHAAAVAVSEKPAKNYNPLFIYGGVGLGKTHLVNAIGLLTQSLYPDMTILYVSAEEFMNELINCIRFDKMPQFREKYRNIDCLLIDDIQFIAGKERTQEEFFHTFNTLHDSSKQIVVTSDNFPKDIPNLESRLRSRFEWGLIADIQPPEMETKIAIIEKKATENNLHISGAISMYLASHAGSNIRELEGFLIRIGAFSSLTSRAVDMDLVREVLKGMLKTQRKGEITMDEIIKTVASRFGVKIADLKARNKNKNIVQARQIIMYLSRKLTNASFPDIGQKLGGRDHSTIIYANNKIKTALEQDDRLRNQIQEMENLLQEGH